MCSGLEDRKTKIPWYHWSGRRRHCWWWRDGIWEQAISKLKKRFTFGHWEVGKGKFCSREVVQAADGSMRVGQPAYFKRLDIVPLGK